MSPIPKRYDVGQISKYSNASFLNVYLERLEASKSILCAKNEQDTRFLLHAFMLEKALYETIYELTVRPEWAYIALKGVACTHYWRQVLRRQYEAIMILLSGD